MHMQGLVPFILPAHILAGGLALVFGYIALYATKGATLHRKVGILFVYAMVTMSLSGALMDALTAGRISVNVVAGLVTFYCVTTALLTVRPRGRQANRVDVLAMLFAVATGILAFGSAFEMVSRGRPEATPSIIFGIVALLAASGDVRMMRAGGVQGRRRIARHLWRMCFAMWVAAASFFWGPPERVPEVIRIPALQAFAVLLPIFAMSYWLWRLRSRRTFRGIGGVAAPHVTAPQASH